MSHVSKVSGKWHTWWMGEDKLWRCARCTCRGVVVSHAVGIGETRDLAYRDLLERKQ